MRTSNRNTRMIAGVAATAALIGSLLVSASAHAKSHGYVDDVFPVGLVYGTFFDEAPNLTLLVGGTVEEFCFAGPDGAPGTAPMRVFHRKNGTVVERVNDKGQPMYLYEQMVGDSFAWIDSVCPDVLDDDPGTVAPEPDATGSAHLKVRNRFPSDAPPEIFNSVKGKLVGSDGARYLVRASAEFILGPTGPVGDPADFVSLDLKPIGRWR